MIKGVAKKCPVLFTADVSRTVIGTNTYNRKCRSLSGMIQKNPLDGASVQVGRSTELPIV